MPYVIINPENMTYDGGYSDKEDAEMVMSACKKEYDAPAMFLAYIDGVASETLEPYFRWMADVEIFCK